MLDAAGNSCELAHAVFAMPVTLDFNLSHQWLRELRRGHDERMVAVHFRLPSDEEVLVGRYSKPHPRVPLREAVRLVLAEPQGNEIVIPRSIRRAEVVGIRDMTQLVGWVETPEQHGKSSCVCPACVPAGLRDLMSRVRGAADRQFTEARQATSPAAVAQALSRLDLPLERAKGRLPPDKLFPYLRAEDVFVRARAARLLGYFPWRTVAAELAACVADPHSAVRHAAVEASICAGGLRRAYRLMGSVPRDTLEWFIEQLEYPGDVSTAAQLLLRIDGGADAGLLDQIGGIARTLLKHTELDPQTKSALAAIAAPGASHP